MVKEHKSGEWSPNLSVTEKETLFVLVADTLAWCTSGGQGEFDFSKYEITETLKQPTHSFVTLKSKGMLRGCIGSLPPSPAPAMYVSVHRNAQLSAMRDTRFHPPYGPGPVTPEELPGLDVHISLLSPVKDIESVDDFVIGQHGIIFIKGGARSVFLPEVAVEQNWDRETTLSHLSRKAGVGADAWRSGARFQVFESVVLSRE